MAGIERRLDIIIHQLVDLSAGLRAIAEILSASSDDEAITEAIAKLKQSGDALQQAIATHPLPNP
jgi:hypothetical protein